MPDKAVLIQFGGSLLAILALAWIASRLNLGNREPIRDEAHAAELADEVSHGFVPVETAIGTDGQAAILRDARGRILVIRKHGGQFAGRILTGPAVASIDGDKLVVDPAEKRFGVIEIPLDHGASAWVQAISAIDSRHDA